MKELPPDTTIMRALLKQGMTEQDVTDTMIAYDALTAAEFEKQLKKIENTYLDELVDMKERVQKMGHNDVAMLINQLIQKRS